MNEQPVKAEPCKLTKGIIKVLWVVLGVLLIAATVSGLIQVIARYIFNHPFTWSDIMALFLYTWMIQIAIPVMFYKRSYLGFTLLNEHLHGKIKVISDIFIDICCIIFTICLFIGAILLIQSVGWARPMQSIKWLPASFMYCAIVLSMLLSTFVIGDHLRVRLKDGFKHIEPKPEKKVKAEEGEVSAC